MSHELPDTLDGIDIADGLKRVAGNRTLLRKLLLRFRAGNAGTVQDVRQALAQDDLELAERLVHTVKGVAGNLGASDLHRAAEAVDAPLKNRRKEAAVERLPELERELDRVLRSTATLEQPATTAPAPAPPAPASATPSGAPEVGPLLDRLERLMAEDDFGAQATAEEIGGKLVDAALKAGFSAAVAPLAEYEFEAALEGLRAWRRRIGQ